jgi:hypothetical protein
MFKLIYFGGFKSLSRFVSYCFCTQLKTGSNSKENEPNKDCVSGALRCVTLDF